MQCGSWASCFRQALCGLHGSSGVDPLRSLWREVRSFRRSNSQNVDSTCNNEIMLFPDTEIVEDTWRDRSVWVEKTVSFCIAGNSKKSVLWRTERNVVRSPIKKRLGGHMSHMSHMSHSDHIRPHTIHQKTWFANHMINHSIYILSSKSRSRFKMFLNPILSVIFYNTRYRASQTEKWEERKFGSLVWGQKLGHSPWFVWEQIRFSFPDFQHIWCIWCVCAFCCKSSNFCGRSMSAKDLQNPPLIWKSHLDLVPEKPFEKVEPMIWISNFQDEIDSTKKAWQNLSCRCSRGPRRGDRILVTCDDMRSNWCSWFPLLQIKFRAMKSCRIEGVLNNLQIYSLHRFLHGKIWQWQITLIQWWSSRLSMSSFSRSIYQWRPRRCKWGRWGSPDT